MSYLRYLCLFAHSGVQHILCCVFLRIVYPMFTVSMDCSFLIAPSVFSHVYVQQKLTLQKFIWDFSRCWLSCLYLLIFLFTKTFKLFSFKYLCFESTKWRLFQKRFLQTKFDISVFISETWHSKFTAGNSFSEMSISSVTVFLFLLSYTYIHSVMSTRHS